MAHLLFEALNGVTLDNQTALTVQSLLDSQVITGSSSPDINFGPPTTVTLDDEDVFQCGKCKKQFTSFTLFMCHKKEHNPDGELQGQDSSEPSDTNGFHHLQVHGLPSGVASPDLGQSIILGDADILSFSIDQGSLNLTSTAQGMSSLSNVIQSGAFLASPADPLSSPRSLAEDETSSTTSSFSLATLAGQPVILASPELAQGTFLTSSLPNISQGKLASLANDSLSSDDKDASRNFSILAAYPNRLLKGCKLLLPNVDYIEREEDESRPMLLESAENINKKTDEGDILNGSKALLVDYSTGDSGKTCEVLVPGVEYSEPAVEYIECHPSDQATGVRQETAVEMLDVVSSSDGQTVTLNLSKSVDPLAGQEVALPMTVSEPDSTVDSKLDAEAERLKNLSYAPRALKLKCDFCPKAFAKNFDLQQHVRSHTGEKPFQCVVCGRAFSQKSNVKKHMATHKVWPNGLSRTLPKQPLQIIRNASSKPSEFGSDGGGDGSGQESDKETNIIIDRSYVCQFCDTSYPSYFELKTHLKEHSHEKVYKCIQRNCQKTFSDLDSFLEHNAAHATEVQYCCHICFKKFTSLADLGIHQYCHNQVKIKAGSKQRYFFCVKCKSKFTSSKALEHHLSTTNHNFPCPNCGKVFACERYLRRHLPTHGAPESYICHVCGKGFRTEQYLNVHQLIHTGEKPYECQHCSAAFNRKDKLVRHSLIHQTVKKFKCPFQKYLGCTKAFNRQDKLKLHILTHSAVKPTQCRKCKKIFTKQALLREHERSHHFEEGYSCERCGRSFKKKGSLSSHVCVPNSRELHSSLEPPVEPKFEPRRRKPRKSKSQRQIHSADIKTEDNVPTIEIIVMPLDRREQEDGEKGVYHLMFPSEDTSQKHSSTEKEQTMVILGENANSKERSEDQQVPTADDDQLLNLILPSNRAS